MPNDVYNVFVTPEYYYLCSNAEKTVIRIDRSSQMVELLSEPAILPGASPIPVYGIWGCIQLISGWYLLVVTSRELVGNIFGHDIWRITRSEVLQFANASVRLTDVEAADEDMYIQMLRSVLSTEGFYYSSSYDLTHTLQRLADTSPELKDKSIFDCADERFVWNRYLLEQWLNLLVASDPVSKQRDLLASKYCLPIIHGFVSLTRFPNEPGIEKSNENLYALISRRSVHRVGTRFNSRGVDQSGNASNTVETEQIFCFDKQRFSFVQLRGSVPLYWSQRPNLRYKPAVLLGGSYLSLCTNSTGLDTSSEHPALLAAQSAVARRHFDQLIYHLGYGRQVIVNLLNQKGMERPLGRSFANATLDLDGAEVKYESFDFHRECGSMRWERLDILLDRLMPDLLLSRQFHFDCNSSRVLSRQTGTFRTNCIDCLDRTNVVQSMLAWRALAQALKTIGKLPNTADAKDETSLVVRLLPGFDLLFKSIWADNADFCSLQYTGTRALKTDFTRTGKRTLRGMLMDGYHSMIRYYLNNFRDGSRQDSMHLFLGQYRIREPNGTLKPLTGPGGCRSKGSGHYESEWRTRFLPLVFTFAVSMTCLCIVFRAPHWTEQATYVLFWGTASVLSLFTMFAYGEEFVDLPRFLPD